MSSPLTLPRRVATIQKVAITAALATLAEHFSEAELEAMHVALWGARDMKTLRVSLTADADIDCDGSGGNPDRDRYFQPHTTLKLDGKDLNAYKVPFIVVPPAVVIGVNPIVMGCLALVTNTLNGKRCICVVGDSGPTRKVGELSVEAAKRLGIPWHPVSGGESRKVIRYDIFPGIPAVVDGIAYKLQPYRTAA